VKNVLHLYSNHKWTGPADHALNLVSWLQSQKALKASFACARSKNSQNHLYAKAGQRGLAFVPGLFLNKHLNWTTLPDIRALRKIVARNRIDLIHSHQDNDTLTAVLAGFGRRTVTTCYDGEPSPLNLRRRFFFRRTARILTASAKMQAYLAKIFPDKWIEQIDIPVDPDRFYPHAKSEKLLAEFGLATDGPVAGIVARVQKYRNFPLLLNALAQVVKQIPDFKFLIVGRGTHIDALACRPVTQMGLEKNVAFTGYRQNDYREVVNLFDFKIFLQPGSDGSCRAVREALACGKPVIATRKGILPELIRDGQTGMLIGQRPSDLARAMVTMTREKDFRLACSRAARQYAQTILSPERYVAKVVDCYESIKDR
jgi:glycosyltransferase involved in cell wall biosynthesis